MTAPADLSQPGERSAVVVDKDGSGAVQVEVRRIPAPTAGPHDLLVRPAYVGICGSDLELLDGYFEKEYPVDYPVILGHEWSGTVVQCGDQVTGFQAGDLITGHGDLGGNRWFGLSADGAMADLFAVPAAQCFPVPAGVSEQRAALIEPLACVLAGLQRAGGADGSHLCVVFGCGTLGLSMAALLVTTGATVVAVDPSAQRRELAVRLGVHAAMEPADGATLLAQLTEQYGAGADLAVEASGSPAAQSAALHVTTRGARVLYMGLAHDDAPAAALRLIQARDLQLFSSSGAPPGIWRPTLRLLGRTGLDLTPAVSQVYPFADVQAAVAAARNPGTHGKVMLRPGA